MRYDRGSATPLAAALIAVVAVATLVVGEVSTTLREQQHARAAAEAIAVAALLGADLDVLAREHSVDTYSVEIDESSATVIVERNGVTAEASAFDHRHTLESDE